MISIRLNRNEENILKYLTNLFDKDRSSIIKDTSVEIYEDLLDLKTIKKFEKDEKSGNASFISVEDALKDILTIPPNNIGDGKWEG